MRPRGRREPRLAIDSRSGIALDLSLAPLLMTDFRLALERLRALNFWLALERPRALNSCLDLECHLALAAHHPLLHVVVRPFLPRDISTPPRGPGATIPGPLRETQGRSRFLSQIATSRVWRMISACFAIRSTVGQEMLSSKIDMACSNSCATNHHSR
jgi:hypothetical protein